MILVYLAGPVPKSVDEMEQAIKMADELRFEGFESYIPQLQFYLEQVRSRTPEEWMSLHRLMLSKCDCVLRMKGESVDADAIIKEAQDNNIITFTTYLDLLAFMREGSSGTN